MFERIGRVGGLAGVIGLTALLWSGPIVRAEDRGGTAWILDGSGGYHKNETLDRHHVIHGSHGGRLAGSSCCERFVLAFPTNDTFSLRHEGYVVATGQVRPQRAGLALVPDEASTGSLLWWLENDLEFFWHVGVTDIGLNLRLTELAHSSMVLSVKNVRGQMRATLKLRFKFRGEVRDFDRSRVRRLSTGPIGGTASFKEGGVDLVSLADFEEYDPGYPLPPVQSCEDKDEDDYEDFSAETPSPYHPAAWPGPDYCRE
jgi:hypothetical protein